MNEYSLWLIPEKRSRKKYHQVISRISRKLKTPLFFPHCTLYGRINLNLEEIKPTIKKIVTNQKEFSALAKKVKTGRSRWKSLYVSLEKNQQLLSLFSICKKQFSSLRNYKFHPHISLTYGLHSKESVYHAMQNIDIPNYTSFSGIAIAETGEDIKKWQIVFQRQLI